MRTIRLTWATCLFFLLYGVSFLTAQPSGNLLIRHVKIVDVARESILPDHQIHIVGDTIRAVGPDSIGFGPAKDTLDLQGYYLIPGLLDAHIHHFQSGGLYARPDVIDLRALKSYEDEQAWLVDQWPDYWRRYLAMGITGAVDMGGPMQGLSLRQQADTLTNAPHLWMSGPLLSSYVPEELDHAGGPILHIESPEAGRSTVLEQYKRGVDFIKIWYIVLRGQTPEAFAPIAEAIIDEAHQKGLEVAVHATELNTARKAVQLGADILVHSVRDQVVDPAFIQLLLENEVYYCPTLTVGTHYNRVLARNPLLNSQDWAIAHPGALGSLLDIKYLPEEVLPEWLLKTYSDSTPASQFVEAATMATNIQLLHKGGVPIITGTDAGNIGTLHASSYAAEIEAMQAAGLTPANILKASTYETGRMLDVPIGELVPGYAADIVILSKNPLLSLQNWYAPAGVIHKGVIHDPEKLIPNSALLTAQRFVNYWRGDRHRRWMEMIHPAAMLRKGARQYSGPSSVALIWKGQKKPEGMLQWQQMKDGRILVLANNQNLILTVKEGSIRRIDILPSQR